MDEPLIITNDVTIAAGEVWFTASRSGGPGGQYVNMTSSRVTLHWNVKETKCLLEEQKTRILNRLAARINSEGILQVSVDSERSRHQNQQIAIERLQAMVRAALAVAKKRIPTKISMAANMRRLREKARVGEVKRRRTAPKAED